MAMGADMSTLAVATSGTMAAIVIGSRPMNMQQFGALAVIMLISLWFGTRAREATLGHDKDPTIERKRSYALFGALFFLGMWLADRIAGNLLTAGVLGVAVGAAGPAALTPLIQAVVGVIERIFPKVPK